jgi:peptidyl-tRNA hydrolase, PTH1 family
VSASGWLVVGLGNPGPAYAGHRHNVGHRVVDVLAARMSTGWRRHRTGRADVAEGRLGIIDGCRDLPRLALVKPRSYMNASGAPVAAVAAYDRISADHVIAVHDELDLGFGVVRAKFGGGDNGHNGLRSLRGALATGDFFRVRVGIGRPPGRQDPADFVLSDFASAQRRDVDAVVERAADMVESLVSAGLDATQRNFHAL